MRMTDQDFEEIKVLYKAVRELPRAFTDTEKELDKKWAPIDITGILIGAVEELKRKTKILQAPLSQVAREHQKMKTFIIEISQVNDPAWIAKDAEELLKGIEL
jgi:hypothetical protein